MSVFWILSRSLALAFLAMLFACSNSTLGGYTPPQNRLQQLQPATFDPNKVAIGQTVYVPVYSHVYSYNNTNHLINLSATLSIRNTDLTNSIIVTAVRYYDTNGKLVKQYIDRPVELKPLASTDVFLEPDDISGGLGANFIVEWVAQKTVYEPTIEAVMISTASAQGISFIGPGKVLKQYTAQK